MGVNTVLGLVAAEDLGITLTHEHFNINYTSFLIQSPPIVQPYIEGEISLDNLGFIRQYPYSCRSNLNMVGDEAHEAVMSEMNLFKESGGGCIVENTTHGLDRNIELMVKISQMFNIHAIAGTGYYLASVQKPSCLNQTMENLYATMKAEVQTGSIDQPTVKCGFIGEVASGWPIHDFEKKCIEATGQAQEELGCGVSFHPGRDPDAPEEILRLYSEAGGKVDKAVMSHLDRTLTNCEELLSFVELGSYCQFDLFGTECSFYQLDKKTDMLSDAQRLDLVIALINEGKIDRITLSHDIHTKHRLVKYGGHGYSHLLNNVVPKMKIKGMDQEQIDTIMIHNPATWLTLPS